MGGHRNSIGFEPDSNRNRIGIESLQKGPLQRIAKDCKGLQSVRWGSFHATLQPRGPGCGFWFGTTCRGVGLKCIRPLAAVTLPGLISKVCIVTTVYILIMGSIRSFDGRNCEWLIKYTRAVSGPSVRIPWPHRGQRVLKLLRLNPCFPDMRRRRVEARVKFAHVPRCTR